MKNIKAFTLIEMLVVVLIIGIITAIALPKYTASLEETKYVELMQIMNDIRKAQEVHKLQTGRYAVNLTDLDFTFEGKYSENGQVLWLDKYIITVAFINVPEDVAKIYAYSAYKGDSIPSNAFFIVDQYFQSGIERNGDIFCGPSTKDFCKKKALPGESVNPYNDAYLVMKK